MITFPEPVRGFLAQNTLYTSLCWKIQRRDGMLLRFTDHDKRLLVNEEWYEPSGAINASAAELIASLGVNNRTAVGAIDSSAISHEDLLNGKYRDAILTEYVVDWRYAWLGPLTTSQYWVVSVTFTGEDWEFEVEGISTQLKPSTLITFTRNCRFTFGDNNCSVDPDQYKSQMTTVSDVTTSGLDKRHKFTIAAVDEADNYYTYGSVFWLTGNGANQETEIASQVGTTVELFMRTDFDIAVGDKVMLLAGCDKLKSTCKNKFNNLANFGGFPDIPGQDRHIFVPDRKE